MKRPSFQFYPGDWRRDPGVQSLDFHDRGVWFEILCLMHESDERGVLLLNGLPMPESALARVLGLDNQKLNETLTTLLEYGVASRRQEDGALICRRMIRDEELSETRRQAGKMGGNPALLKQKGTTRDKQKATPSSSSSSSASATSSLRSDDSAPLRASIETDNPDPPDKPPKRRTNVSVERMVETLPELSETVAADYLVHRKSKRAPLTETAWTGICRNIAKAQAPPDEALTMAMARGWQGFEAEWWASQRQKPAGISKTTFDDTDYDLDATQAGFAMDLRD